MAQHHHPVTSQSSELNSTYILFYSNNTMGFYIPQLQYNNTELEHIRMKATRPTACRHHPVTSHSSELRQDVNTCN